MKNASASSRVSNRSAHGSTVAMDCTMKKSHIVLMRVLRSDEMRIVVGVIVDTPCCLAMYTR